MIKKLRIYQISLIAVSMICIGLLAFMGITAIQKSLTLNLKFNATPEIYCKLAVGETVLFDNKTLEVHPLSTLSGNTLTFDASVFSSDLGVTTFNLTITNYSETENDIGVTFENATISNNANNSNVIMLGNSETLQITPTGIVEVKMKKVVPINLSLAGVSINYAESNVFEDGGHYAPIGENLKIVIDLEDNYGNPQYSLGGNSQGAVSGNTITIDSSNISEGVNLNIQAEKQTPEATFVLTTGEGDYSEYLGLVITNDPGFNIYAEEDGRWYNLYFNSTSEGGEPADTVLNNVAPGEKPIYTKQSGTGYDYYETYYNTTDQTYSSSLAINPGDYIFIFANGYYGGGTFTSLGYIKDYSSSIDPTEIIYYTSENYHKPTVLKYVMPSDNTSFTVKLLGLNDEHPPA